MSSEIGTRTSCSLIPSAWPWTHSMDPIQPPPLLRSDSRWRTYHRVRGAFSHLPGSLLIRLSQQAIKILTDEGRFLSDLFQSRKSSVVVSLATRSGSRDGQGD